METCYGCGAETRKQKVIRNDKIVEVSEHPVIGVINAKDVDPEYAHTIGNPRSEAAPDGEYYVGVPVCAACHQDPQHRSQNALKCHFHYRGNAAVVGLVLAGSSNLGG